jgi:hypothetical protein
MEFFRDLLESVQAEFSVDEGGKKHLRISKGVRDGSRSKDEGLGGGVGAGGANPAGGHPLSRLEIEK